MNRDCPVCVARSGATAHDVLYEVRGFPIARCTQCGLGSTVTPHGFDPSSIYDEAYFQGGRGDGYADYAASEPVLRSEFARALAHLRREGPRSGKLFEIGSAYGFFLLEAMKHFEAEGTEISPAAAAHARARGAAVRTGEATEEALAARGALDAIAMLDVVEHLDDPRGVLERVARSLRPGGALLLSTGDWGSLLARGLGSRWRLMTPPQHLFFFDERTITALLEAVGLTVVSVERPGKLVPATLVAYQLARYAGPFAPLAQRLSARVPDVALPMNLFDAMRVVALKPA